MSARPALLLRLAEPHNPRSLLGKELIFVSPPSLHVEVAIAGAGPVGRVRGALAGFIAIDRGRGRGIVVAPEMEVSVAGLGDGRLVLCHGVLSGPR